jgi:hypothetical protein
MRHELDRGNGCGPTTGAAQKQSNCNRYRAWSQTTKVEMLKVTREAGEVMKRCQSVPGSRDLSGHVTRLYTTTVARELKGQSDPVLQRSIQHLQSSIKVTLHFVFSRVV